MKFLGIFQLLVGFFVLWLGLDTGAHGAHLPTRVNETIAPIVSEALRTTPDDIARSKKEKEFHGVIGAIYVFVSEANDRLFYLGVHLLAIGVLQTGFGAFMLLAGKKKAN